MLREHRSGEDNKDWDGFPKETILGKKMGNE